MKKQKKQFRKPGRFPEGVARFFNPHKSGTNAEYDPITGILKSRAHISIRR